MQALKGPSDWVRAVVLSPGGKPSMYSSDDMTARLWDVSTRALLSTCMADSFVVRYSFSKNGSCLETEKGLLAFLPASSYTYSTHQPSIAHSAIPRVILQDRWIVGIIGKLLWLPSDYKAHCSDVRNGA